ncbi:MAG TPA: DUF222 domain-containing protein [Steroidobacteraceae bacterium]|jgi:hypothetical protein
MDGSLPSFEDRGAFIRSTHELEDQIIELAGHLNAANYRFLSLLAEFDRRKGWNCRATRDCAHWLNWKCGIDLGAAREKVRTARALENLPQVSAAMARGEISYSNVRAITRVATPENEQFFVNIALHGTAHHVETLVRAYRRAEEQELSREQQQQKNREARYCWDYDGSLVLKARLPADVGALVLKAIEAAVPETFDDKTTWSQKRADALAVIFESFMAHGAEAMTGGERHQVVVHVSAETLQSQGGHQCEIEDGPAIAAETARRVACDASVVSIVENEKGEPLSVGRKTRTIPPALQRALNARDKGCRFPGCTHKKYTNAHHIQHWAKGGETKMSNLVTLCRFHHRKVHEGQVIVQVLDDGAIRFLQPNGESFDSPSRSRGDWLQLVAVHEQAGISIDAMTAATRWDGGSMNYGIAMDVLGRLRRQVSAET